MNKKWDALKDDEVIALLLVMIEMLEDGIADPTEELVKAWKGLYSSLEQEAHDRGIHEDDFFIDNDDLLDEGDDDE